MAEENKEKVDVTMLGLFSVSYGGKTVYESRHRDTMSWQLLKYLFANPGRTISQSELLRVLWPAEENKENISGTLRVRLRRLRESLAPLGLNDRTAGLVNYFADKYCINPDYSVSTDVNKIVLLHAAAFSEEKSAAARLKSCYKALELFSGEYLENSASSFWIEIERRQYRELFCELTELAMKLAAETGCFDRAELLCAKALTMAPQDEELQTKIMSFLLGFGLNAEAVKHYSNITKITESIGAKPPPLTAFSKY